MATIVDPTQPVPRPNHWRRLALASVAFFAVEWIVLGGWYDGESEFRLWSLLALPLWSAHLLVSHRHLDRRLVLPGALLIVWGILWWLTTCSYPGSTPGEECYVTRAQSLLWQHQKLVPLIYGLFPLLVSSEMLRRMHRETPA